MSAPPTTPNSISNKDHTPTLPMSSTLEVPNAPKKKEQALTLHRLDKIPKLVLPEEEKEEEEEEEEEEEYDLRYVREKYQRYWKGYVLQSSDLNELHQIRRWYNPASQPRNEVEWNYIGDVHHAATERLRHLQCTCDDCSDIWDGVDDEDLLDYIM